MKKDETGGYIRAIIFPIAGRYNKIQRHKIPYSKECYPSSPFGTDFSACKAPARVEIQWKETSSEWSALTSCPFTVHTVNCHFFSKRIFLLLPLKIRSWFQEAKKTLRLL